MQDSFGALEVHRLLRDERYTTAADKNDIGFIYSRTQRIHTLIKNYKEYRENTLGKGQKSMLAELPHCSGDSKINPKSQRKILNQK